MKGNIPMNLLDIAKDGTSSQLADFLRSYSVNDSNDLSNALSAAVMREDIACTNLLLEHGAIPNCRPSEYMPPIHCAVEQKNRELVQLLFNHGADVNYPNEMGYTPLHLAVDVEADTAWQRGETPSGAIVQLLLTLGANPAVEDATGSTPLSIAEQYGFSRAIELFKMKGNEK